MEILHNDSWSEVQLETLTRTMKAIAHPVRLAIIRMLDNENKMTVTEIYTALDADQSFVSHHLSILRDRGILGTQRKGKYILYYLKEPIFLSLLDCLASIQSPVYQRMSA